MSIVMWEVSAWADKPRRYEFDRETEKCWFSGKGRYLKAGSTFCKWFTAEAEALEFIAQRKVREGEAAQLRRIKEYGPELLEALVEVLADAEWGQFMNESERGNGREIEKLYEDGDMPEALVKARALIAKLKPA